MSNPQEDLEAELDEIRNVEDDEDDEEGVARYEITSYGVDFDVEGLVKRIKRGDIYIPEFQRDFVWKLPESSRLIESLLLGLPVPGVFLAQEPETGKLLVIDGQQRLLSLYFFFEGFFNFKDEGDRKRVFKLTKVQPNLEGKTFETLETKDRINLENTVIHATVVKQDAPSDDDTSIYHIFERLNSGGRKLMPQEIRSAIYHGKLISFTEEINKYESWRFIYGKNNERMKDRELILRFFAMYEGFTSYKSPMKDFISRFTKKYRSDVTGAVQIYADLFKRCCDVFCQINNGKPFRVSSALNVAFFEAAMVGLAKQISKSDGCDIEAVDQAYQGLQNDKNFIDAISQSTANVNSVTTRIGLAMKAFEGV